MSLLTFIAAISILIGIHELGHYSAARWFGIRIKSFSIGMGPEIVGRTDRRGTRWRLSALPIGGYVMWEGDANVASTGPEPGADLHPDQFYARPLWQRAVVTAAGPAINFLFAWVVIAGLIMATGRPLDRSIVGTVQPGSVAAVAGLRPGDHIQTVGDQPVTTFIGLGARVRPHPGQPVTLGILRDGVRLSLTVTPRPVQEADERGRAVTVGLLGIAPPTEAVGPLAAMGQAAKGVGLIVRQILDNIGMIVTGTRPFTDLGGPVKIAQVSAQAASAGVATSLGFLALISINLGFMNLLPIPLLDGGHLFLYALQAIRRRPLGQRVQAVAFATGLALLVSLMLVVTWNDLGMGQRLTGLLG